MKEKKQKSRFNKCVKVRPEQKQYLEEEKDTRTIAGFLDKIINYYKQHHAETRRSTPATAGEATQ